MWRRHGASRSSARHAVDAGSILGVSALWSTFLDNVPAARARQAQASGRRNDCVASTNSSQPLGSLMNKHFLDDDIDEDPDEDDDFDENDDELDEDDEDEDEDVETWQVLQTDCGIVPLSHTLSLTSGTDVLDWPRFPAELTLETLGRIRVATIARFGRRP
jgi:hypothetical protein